jgi:NADPH:quinone reductase-like Zn-dependent oxidoreductase
MKAIVRTQYGPPDVLQFAEVEKPIPKNDEVLIKLCAASVNPVDLFRMRGAPLFRLLSSPKQKVLGCDIAGQVEAVGKDVRQFQPGDEVFGVTGFGGGGFAEFVCAIEDKLALKPSNISFEDAAVVPIAAITALQGLRDKGQIQRGQKVLVDGASGGVGTFAVQIAKSCGAEVTAVFAAREIWRLRDLSAQTTLWTTRGKISQRMGRDTPDSRCERSSCDIRLQTSAKAGRNLCRGRGRCGSNAPSPVTRTITIANWKQEDPRFSSEY